MKLLSSLFIMLFAINVSFAQDDDVKNWIKETSAKIAHAMQSGENQEWMMSLYADDIYSLPSYEPMIVGKEALMASYAKMKESGVTFNSVNFDQKEIVVNGNWAYEIGTYEMSMNIPGMEEGMSDNGKYLTIWKNTDNGWKIAVETWNSDINPWMGMMGEEE